MNRIKLTKKSCDIFYKKIIRLIRHSEPDFFRFKKLRGAMGYCEWENGIILDYRRELVPTLIHECVHFIEPEWSESQVLYAEKRIINTLNNKQIINLLRVFINRIP